MARSSVIGTNHNIELGGQTLSKGNIVDYEYTLNDIITLVTRRLRLYAFIVAVALGTGSFVIYTLPPAYEAKGTVLVESQQIPSDFVQSTITSAAQERIRLIEQRVIVRSKLADIIDKFDMYQTESLEESLTSKVDRLRQNLNVSIESVSGSRSRRNFQDSVILTLAFTHSEAETALKVTNEFITLFLQENVRSRTERASDTTEFLTEELTRLQRRLSDIDEEIIVFKRENSRALPEHLNLHFSMLSRAKDDLNLAQERARRIESDIRLLKNQASALQAGRNTTEEATVFTPQRELVELQSRLSELRLLYRDSHPEVRSVLSRINALNDRIKSIATGSSLAELIARSEAKLQVLETEGQSNSDEADALRADIKRLNAQLESTPGEQYQEVDRSLALSKARLEIALENLETESRALQGEIKRHRDEIVDLEERIQLTPRVESELRSLERNYNQTLAQVQDLQRKRQEAELAQNLEEDQKAERFVLVDPPVLPETPSKPNRLKLMAMLLVVAFGGTAAVVFGKDILLGTLLSARQLKHILGDVPVTSTPYIALEFEDRRRRLILIAIILGLPALAMTSLTVIHFFIRPLDSYLSRITSFL